MKENNFLLVASISWTTDNCLLLSSSQPPGTMAVPGAYQGPGGLANNPPGGVHMFNPAQQPGMIPGGERESQCTLIF